MERAKGVCPKCGKQGIMYDATKKKFCCTECGCLLSQLDGE